MTNEKSSISENEHVVMRILILFLGLCIMAFGVAFSIKSDMGTSPISTLPYVTSLVTGLSVGTTTIIMNVFFVLLQILILRKNYKWFQLLQIPAAIVFGLMIDIAETVIINLACPSYFVSCLYCFIGIVLIALGIRFEVEAGLITTAGEGIVLAICEVKKNLKFGNVKICFDLSLVITSLIISLVFLSSVQGIREGTAAAAVFVGLFTKLLKDPVKKAVSVFYNKFTAST